MRSHYVIAILLLLGHACIQVVSISRKSLTGDEIVHIPAGYYYWTAGDFRLNSEHPPVVKLWAAVPLVLLSSHDPVPSDWDVPKQPSDFHRIFWRQHAQDFERFAFWSRIMMVPVTLTLGLLIFLYARKLFGVTAGLFALVLFCTEPTILAHGRIVHTDVPASLGYLAFFVLLHRYLERRSLRRALWLGMGSGVALLTKFSMIVVVPVLSLVFIAEMVKANRGERRHPGIRFLASTLVVLIAVNIGYLFQHPELNESDSLSIAGHGPYAQTIARWIRTLLHVLPPYFLFGLSKVMAHNQYGHPASLFGMQSTMGWWYYFPAAFALKTAIPFLLTSIAGLVWGVYSAIRGRSLAHVALLVPIGVYSAVSMTSHINIGIRHFLPVFPFLIILSGGLLQALTNRFRVAGVASAVVIVGWCLAEAAWAFPNYTPYMNEFAREPGWRYLSDSNVEWGDDIQDLAAYLKFRGVTNARCALLGDWSMGALGVHCSTLFGADGPVPTSGYVAIGASFLNGSTVPYGEPGTLRDTEEKRVNYFAAYRDRKPETVLGGSIYLYRLP